MGSLLQSFGSAENRKQVLGYTEIKRIVVTVMTAKREFLF